MVPVEFFEQDGDEQQTSRRAPAAKQLMCPLERNGVQFQIIVQVCLKDDVPVAAVVCPQPDVAACPQLQPGDADFPIYCLQVGGDQDNIAVRSGNPNVTIVDLYVV